MTSDFMGGSYNMTLEILVVDDQPGIRLLLTDILTNEGYVITTASTGKEAVDILKEKKFALMVLDYKLPIIDGMEVLRIIDELNILIPAIVMSGLVEKIEEDVKTNALVKKLIAKPFNIHEIPEVVKQVIQDSHYGLNS